MTIPTHAITVIINGKKVVGWKSYSIENDILQPADSFDLTLRFNREAWALCRTDAEVAIFVDDTRILTGYIDSRSKQGSNSGTNLMISGRDKTGRLVDESAPLFRYGGLRLKGLCEKIVGIGTANPLFKRVTLDNKLNRQLLRSVRAHKARTVNEPIRNPVLGTFAAGTGPLIGLGVDPDTSFVGQPEVELRPELIFKNVRDRIIRRPPIVTPGIFNNRSASKKVTPGQSRWAVLEEFLKEARLIAWARGNGEELFVGLPLYKQKPQYAFIEAATESSVRDRTNCRISITENVAELYSKITAVGASRGSGSSYGSNITKNRATVYDNPKNTPDGTGARFVRRKALLITDDGVTSKRRALERAEREQLEREAQRLEITVTAPGHSQLYSGNDSTKAALFTVDTIAFVWDEDTGLKGDFYVTKVNYTRSVDGTETELTLVPKDTLLQL